MQDGAQKIIDASEALGEAGWTLGDPEGEYMSIQQAYEFQMERYAFAWRLRQVRYAFEELIKAIAALFGFYGR